MTAILTVTLNPALDISTYAAKVEAGPKLRCEPPQMDPGGGGVNVSRAIARLGGDSLALVALGGPTGATLAELLTAEGIRHEILEAPGDTRSSFSVIDRSSGKPFRFVLPGPRWEVGDVSSALTAITALAEPGGIVVLSGSNPPGVAQDFAALVQRALEGKARLLVDTSGAQMRALAERPSRIFLLRLNGEEAEEMAGQRLTDAEATARFAQGLIDRGVAETVILARGADGNVLVSKEGAWHARAPLQRIISPVGAGDTFVGTFTLSLASGTPLPEALRHASAAAAAALLTEATDLCRPEDVARIRTETELTSLTL